jgi:tetratricopeptide (TPR) repeat protein
VVASKPFTLLALGFAALACVAQTVDDSLQALLSRYRSEPTNAFLCEQIGVLYTRVNEFEKAVAFFRKAVALNPDRMPAQKNLATVLWFLGHKSNSTALFTALEKRIPNDPVPQLYLGLSAYDEKNMEMAAQHFDRAGALASENSETLPFVIESYLATNRSEKTIHLLEGRIASRNADSQTYRWLGDAYDQQTLPEKAFQAYSKAIDEEPDLAENYLALAGFSIEHANPTLAREVLTRGLKRATNPAKLQLEMGLAWAIEGNFETAKQSFKDANTAEPKWPMPLLALGVTDLQTGDAEQAAECFHEARRIAPDDYRCYYLHALALNRSQKSQDADTRALAISELERAVALDPHRAEPRIALAQTEMAGGHLGEAEHELRVALHIEPNEPTALYKLALLCRREGKTQEAARLLRAFEQSKTKSHSEENQFVLILRTVK